MTRDRDERTGTPGWVRAAAAARVAGLILAGVAATACDCQYDNGQSGTISCDEHDFYNFAVLFEETHHGKIDSPDGWMTRATTPKKSRIVTDPNTLTFLAPAAVPAPNVAEVRIPCDLIPPFRVESTVGLCDPAFSPVATSVFGLGVVDRTDATHEFSADCSRVGGITATASFGTPVPTAFAGAQRVDLALEHDGANLIASARDHDKGGTWIEVSRTPLAATGPYLPKLGALNFDPGQMVSYYSFRVVTNGSYAQGQSTPQLEAVRELCSALNDLANGADRLVSPTPDAAGATAQFQAANERVQAALAALEGAAKGKRPSAAARRLKKARKAALKAAKSVAKSLTTLDTGGTAKTKTVLKGVASAALSLAQAGDAILPDDLRAAIGGLTLKSFLGK